MNASAALSAAEPAFAPHPVEIVPGAVESGALILCDHASNAVPDDLGDLGLPAVEFQRHIAYDIGAAAVTRALAASLGAPAILTEYMLAGLPVLANDRLVCGRQYIRPDTGLTAPEDRFHEALASLIARSAQFDTRAVVQANWTWPHSIRQLTALIDKARGYRAGRVSA